MFDGIAEILGYGIIGAVGIAVLLSPTLRPFTIIAIIIILYLVFRSNNKAEKQVEEVKQEQVIPKLNFEEFINEWFGAAVNEYNLSDVDVENLSKLVVQNFDTIGQQNNFEGKNEEEIYLSIAAILQNSLEEVLEKKRQEEESKTKNSQQRTRESENPYDVLGVSDEDDLETIRLVYRNLAKTYHPDRNKSEAAERKFKKVTEAWEEIQKLKV